MSRYTYTKGQWTDGNDLPEWADNEDFSEYLDRVGYSPAKLCVGSEHGSCIDIYESSDLGSFYASVAPLGGTCYEVFLPDFPSLMLFLKDFGPIFSALNIESDQSEILKLLEKLFRAYHGHEAYAICKQCDPTGWEANIKRREENSKIMSGKTASEA